MYLLAREWPNRFFNPHISLSFNLCCVTSITIIYHPTFYINHFAWSIDILPIFQLLVSSFHLKYIFLSRHHDPGTSCSLSTLVLLIQTAISSLYPLTRSILWNNIGDNLSCYLSFLCLSLSLCLKFHHINYLYHNIYHPSLIRFLGYRLISIHIILAFTQQNPS